MDGQVRHPKWCTGNGCVEDGVHTSQPLSANLGKEATAIGAYLSEVEHQGMKIQGIVLQFVEGSRKEDRECYLLEMPQARELVKILRRLDRMA